MTDVVAQREARRLKLLKNAENRMNRLRSTTKGGAVDCGEPVSSSPEFQEVDTGQDTQSMGDSDSERSEQIIETKTSSPYNLRNRTSKPTTEPSVQVSTTDQNRPSTPYQIVEDPEVPSLAEFLATQEAAKTTDGRKNTALPKRQKDQKGNWVSERHLEYIRIAGLFFTALLARWFLSCDFGFNIFILEIIFQSMFFPFLVFEVLITYIVHEYMKHLPRSAPQGSLLVTALMLCGVKPELVQVYIKIMGRVTVVSNDLFLYIFAFIVWHLVWGV